MPRKKITVAQTSRLPAGRKKMKYPKELPERFNDLHWVARKLDEIDHYPADRVWEKVLAGVKERHR